MATAGSALSTDSDPVRAGREAAESALAAAGLDRAEAALLLATPDHGDGLPDLVAEAGRVLGGPVVGATGQGVMAGGAAQESGPGVAVLALGCPAHPFLLEGPGEEVHAGEDVLAALGRAADPDDLVVLLPDPYAISPDRMLQSLGEALGPASIVGAGAVEGPGVPPAQWLDDRLVTGGVAGIVIPGAAAPRIGVTQACTPVTPPLQVTRTDGPWILELDGRPALDVFREVARGPLAEDLRRAAAFLFAAFPDPQDPEGSLAAGDYRVRNVVGFVEERRAVSLAASVRTGERIAWVLREPHGARDDLKRMLSRLAGEPEPGLGVYLDCCARGRALFEVPGLEAAYLAEALGALPWIGTLGAYEIGPVRGRTELLTYTGVLALARPVD